MDATPEPVDGDDEYPIELMPSSLKVFTDPALRKNPALASAAAEQLWFLLRDIIAVQVQLEWIQRGLRASPLTGGWVDRALADLRRAANGFETVISGVGNAEDAVRMQRPG